jgi:hypothetical protein
MAADPRQFRSRLVIDVDGRPTPLRLDAWQEAALRALDPALLAVAGRGDPPAVRKHWWERPRGCSKTADLAILATWILAFSARPSRGVAAAGDTDQARLLKDAIAALLRCNGFLQSALTLQQNMVRNPRTGAELQIISSDVATSFGLLCDYILVDEVCHWQEGRGEGLWQSLYSASAKRGHTVMVAATNAGFQETWVWATREAIRVSPEWFFMRLESCEASWIPKARLDEQRRVLPPVVWDRLWGNVWSSGSGDALQPADLAAALTLPGPPAGKAREEGFTYFAGLDLGVSRDHSALVVIGRHWGGRVKLVDVRDWAPPPGGKIDLGFVEEACLATHQRLAPRFMLDPYQSEMLGARLKQAGCRVEFIAFAGKSLTEMASGLVEVFATRAIDLFPDAALLDDLRRLRIREAPSGWRLDAPRTSAGHCDRGVALSLALLGARRQPSYPPGTGEPVVLIGGRGDVFAGDWEQSMTFVSPQTRNRTGVVDADDLPPRRLFDSW